MRRTLAGPHPIFHTLPEMEDYAVRKSGRDSPPERGIVLLVEDDVHDVELMKLAFRAAQSPFLLRTVSHGGEAIEYLEGRGEFADREKSPAPVLVLLDLKLPIVDGFDVLRWLQANSTRRMPPVVVLSYSTLEEDRRLARQLGASEFIIKPVDFGEAVKVAKRLIETYQISSIRSGLEVSPDSCNPAQL